MVRLTQLASAKNNMPRISVVSAVISCLPCEGELGLACKEGSRYTPFIVVSKISR